MIKYLTGVVAAAILGVPLAAVPSYASPQPPDRPPSFAAGFGAAGHRAAAASGPGWSVTPTPNPRVPTGQLFWVSCTTADSCMAVGVHVTTSGQGVSLAEQWNGTAWRILPTPNPPGATFSALQGVACPTPSACTAVGASITAGASRALAERWSGTRWTIQPTPSPPQGGGFLNAVSCTSASACTAVGSSSAGTLAERWDGTRWTIQATPDPPQGGGSLSGVSCSSASACTAVGASHAFTPTATTLAERWDGTRWTIQATPNPPQGGGGLNGVACPSASTCTAVGESNAGTLAERWDGTSWRIQPTPAPARAQSPFLNSVACTAPSACTAVGAANPFTPTPQTLAEHWDGTRWSIQATPSPGPSVLIGLACAPATSCTAVGFSDLNGSTAVLVERSPGTTWSAQAAPSPPGAAASFLNSVWCASRSACVTVGATTSRSRAVATLAQRWNGRAWRIQPIPSPAGGGALNSVSCTSLSACTAVGGTASGTTLAERWNGTSWRIQATPSPAGGGFLNSVSCPSATACTAVGNSNNGKTLAERWDGTRWRIQATPNPVSSAPFSGLASVACASSSACMAVGGKVDHSFNAEGTLAEQWNGRTWRIVPTFKPAGLGSFLNGVACTLPSACTAVGSSSLVTTLAERWNGTRWQVQPTPNPPGGQNIFLASVACPTSSACTAFGLNLTGAGPFTLAERWNGHGWRIQPTPIIQTFDIGFPGVACPTVSSCFAVASWKNNGDPSLTLAEQWTNASDSHLIPAPSSGLSPGPACPRPLPGTPLLPGALSPRLGSARPSLSRSALHWITPPPWCRAM